MREREEEPCAPEAPPAAQADDCRRPDCPLLNDSEYQRKHDRGYSLRRAWYIGTVTAFCLIVPAVVVFGGYTGDLSNKLVEGLLGLASTVAISYLCAGVVDRSQVLARIGDRWRRDSGDKTGGP